MILEKIDQLLKEVGNLQANNAEEIEQLRLKYLSKKGEITALMADFRNVAADQKKAVGMKINELKQLAMQKINELKEQNEVAEESADDFDLTRSAYPIQLGTRHPLNIVKNQIIDIFQRMGFTLAEGPEIDDDLHVFTKLNFAADHPARDMQDTFFIEQSPNDVTKNILLRSHTSNDQSRIMEHQQPPIRVICPGRVYRNEAISARSLLLPPVGGSVCRQERFVHRPQTGAPHLRPRAFRSGHQDSSAPQLLPLHRAKCRNGHIMPHLWRQGLRILQAHRMG